MELIEINSTSFPIKLYSTYTLKSSKTGYFSMLSKSVVEIIQFKSSLINDLNAINLEVLQADCDLSTPVENIKMHTSQLMNNSRTEDRLQVLLDNTLIPSVSSNSNARIIDHAWAPPVNFISNDSLLLTFTNNGVLILNCRESIVQKSLELSERKFLPIKNLTDLRLEQLTALNHALTKSCGSIKELKKQAEHILIQSVCWLNELYGNKAFIACAYRNAEISFFYFDVAPIMNLTVKLHDDSFEAGCNVTIMKWMVVQENITFLVCGCQTGEVKLFRVILDEGPKFLITPLADVWNERDDISIRYIDVQRCHGNVLIVVAKEQHIVMTLLDRLGTCLTTEIYYFDWLSIGGITDLPNYGYLIASVLGHVEFLQIVMSANSFVFNTQPIKCGVDCSKWKICGVSSSENSCLVMFAVNPLIDFDHLQLRCPTNIIVCHLNTFDPYKILRSNESYNLSQCYDAVETIRQLFFRNKEMDEDFMGSLTENMNHTDEFLYRLKLKLIVYGSKAGYFRFRSEKRQLANLKYFEICTTAIEVIGAINNLEYLNGFYRNNNFSSKMQMQAAKCLRIFLLKFASETLEEEPFDVIQKYLQIEINRLLQATVYLDACESELCNYCYKCLPNDQLICANAHVNERCFITQMQIPNFKSRWCGECRKQCLVEESINEIFVERKISNLCFLCGLALVSYVNPVE